MFVIMEFDDLIGKEVTLVGYTKEFDINNGSAMIVEFLYNNKTHIIRVSGDDDDGYRSYLNDVEFITNQDGDYKKRTYISLPPVKVKIVFNDDNRSTSYEFIDDMEHTWISFGTDNQDDYYPWYFLNISDIDLKSWREAKLNDIL